jgi:hypothetical protein
MIAGLLRELNETEMALLLEWIDRPPAPDSAIRLQEMFRLLEEGNLGLVPQRLAEFAPLDPQRAEALPPEAAFAPVRAPAEAMLTCLALSAKLHAQARLAEAERVASGGVAPREIRPEILVPLAQSLLDAGGYANAMTASYLAQILIEATQSPAGRPASHDERQAAVWPRVRRLWQRAPLLILLVGWLFLGLSGCLAVMLLAGAWTDSAFETWGIGFLVLVAFGFYMRIRRL